MLKVALPKKSTILSTSHRLKTILPKVFDPRCYTILESYFEGLEGCMVKKCPFGSFEMTFLMVGIHLQKVVATLGF